MALAAYYRASGETWSRDLSKQTFENILARRNNPKGIYNKNIDVNRALLNHTFPMILINLINEIRDILDWPAQQVQEVITDNVNQVMTKFVDSKRKLVFENINPDGTHPLDIPEGRLINPGHAIESMGFILVQSIKDNNHKVCLEAIEALIAMLEFGWDKEYGGITYFMDSEGLPPTALEHNMKLWWPHAEALWALLKCIEYLLEQDKLKHKALINTLTVWYEKVHLYSFSHFSDHTLGEWYGYLDRQGNITHTFKGGPWKGCFHVPRCCLWSWQIADKITELL